MARKDTAAPLVYGALVLVLVGLGVGAYLTLSAERTPPPRAVAPEVRY